MTTPNNSRARTAVRAILAAGGLAPLPHARDVSATQLLDALDALDALGLDVRPGMADYLAGYAELYGHLAGLVDVRPSFTLEDLQASDHAARFREATLSGLVAHHGRQYADQVRGVLDSAAQTDTRGELPAIVAAVSDLYAARAEEYWHLDDYALSGAQKDERAALRRAISRVHTWALWASPGQEVDGPAEWLLLFEFDTNAWARLCADSLPGFRARGNELDFALSCGARPRLAASYAQVASEYAALRITR